jgi:hypothetical protein
MTYFGKIWLKDGRVLSFSWTIEFFIARAFYEKKNQVERAIHTVWATLC